MTPISSLATELLRLAICKHSAAIVDRIERLVADEPDTWVNSLCAAVELIPDEHRLFVMSHIEVGPDPEVA